MADEMLDRIDTICDHFSAALGEAAQIEDQKLLTVAAQSMAAAVARRTMIAGMPPAAIVALALRDDADDVRASGERTRADLRHTVLRLIRICDAVGEETAAAGLNSALVALGGTSAAPRPASLSR